ncbi:RNA polymerase sigma factor [Chitinophaga japonensis]|uniref:RNA polymerase sigma-70 factor (ECF subfamily) n=1 Tax=Chitinophaga japonensis TaxID=104662 RepID=A0A562TET8_CHIJA|nr:sigma-70 family RNA polymerase sigma factor [Chitinophaga japonensis]TWI91616.1 RNA polymerase sigma-70 factor (ECF subfamily) [Chitinophaga japonensis]
MHQIAAIRSGSFAVFEEVYYQFHEKLYYYFLKRTTAADVAEELVQLTFIKLWRYRSSLNEELPLSQQLFRIARTTLIDVLRRKAQQRSVSLPNHWLPETEDTTAAREERETLHLVRQAIETLPPGRKKIFQYRIDGFSNREIAARLSLSVKTVENQLNRAIKQLREVL